MIDDMRLFLATHIPEIVTMIGIVVSLFFSTFNVYMQFKTLKQKQKQDMFEIRFEFYKELLKLREELYSKNTSIEKTTLFLYARKASFLFGKDIKKIVLDLNKEYQKSKSYNDTNEFDKHFEKYLKL